MKIDFKLDTKKPDFLKMNPNGKVPLLVHDGTPIFESVAIIAHLGETFGVEKNLFPAPDRRLGEDLHRATGVREGLAPRRLEF